MNTQTKKPKQAPFDNDRLLEQLRDMSRGISKSLSSDVFSGVATDALSSLFGTPQNGEMSPGQEINFADKQVEMPEKYRPQVKQTEQLRPAFSNELLSRARQEEMLVGQKIEEIRQELKALVAAIKSVDQKIVQAVNEQVIDPGVYHLNYLDRIKTILKLLRQNLSESASWLTVMRSRKKQRNYWAQYKKKGTEWGLNADRVIASQVG